MGRHDHKKGYHRRIGPAYLKRIVVKFFKAHFLKIAPFFYSFPSLLSFDIIFVDLKAGFGYLNQVRIIEI